MRQSFLYRFLLREWRLPVLLCCLLTMGQARAQAPAWQAAELVGLPDANGGSSSIVTATATDANGNVYVAGTFYGTVTVGATTLTNGFMGNTTGAFVAKWSPVSRSFAWAQRIYGSGSEDVTGLAVSGVHVYVSGTFYGRNVVFGNALSLTNAGPTGGDVFVAQLTDTGPSASFTWAQRAGGTGADYASGLAVDGANVYLTGTIASPAAQFGGTTLSTAGIDAFVAKLTDTGPGTAFVWAKQARGDSGNYGAAIAVNGPNVYVAGDFQGTVAFDGATLVNADASRNSSDVFVAQLADAGPTASFTWAQRAGGIGQEQVQSVGVRGADVYVGGAFFGSTTAFGSTSLTNAGPAPTGDVFVAKLTDAGASGAFRWAQRAGGRDDDRSTRMGVNGTGVYLVGYFGGAATTADFGNTVLSNAGFGAFSTDGFVAKLIDAGGSGFFAWAVGAGGTREDRAYAVAVAGAKLYVVGFVAPPATFGGVTLPRSPAANGTVGFLASLTDNAALATASPVSNAPALTLFPNPASGTVKIKLSAFTGATHATLTLTDALGREVGRQAVPLPTAGLLYDLPLAGLPSGVYGLHVQAGELTVVQKLVIE